MPALDRAHGRAPQEHGAGVVQASMEETAEWPDAAGTFAAMGIGEVARGVGMTVRSGEPG